MTTLTFLEAKVGRLCKTVSPSGITPYPNAAQFRSHIHPISTLQDFADTLREHAGDGHCLHIGDLIQPLTDWGRRAGMAKRDSELHWFTIDIDGIRGVTVPGQLDEAALAQLALTVLNQIDLPLLRDTSFIAQASTKLGIEPDKVSLHLFYMLDGPVFSTQLKAWLKELNLSSPMLEANIQLSANGHALKWPLDISCADIGRLIYIAPPQFTGLPNPFPNGRDRVAVVMRPGLTIPAAPIRSATANQRAENRIKQNLRELAGLNPNERARMRTVTINGEQIDILLNPARGIMRLAQTARGFCYYNLNDGDSNAYFHPENRPDIIHNFKGEPAFRWADVDPDGYRTYCEENAEAIAKADPINTFMVVNQADDLIYKIWHDHEAHTVAVVKSSRDQITDFYTEYGKLEPDFLPTWTIEYKPSGKYQVDYTGQTINTFVPSAVMKLGQVETLPYILNADTAHHIGDACPSIWFLLDHMTGNSKPELLHFLHWLAYIVQARTKAETAWIFQGSEGTGKGTLFNEVIRPLFGDSNVTMKHSNDLNDQFNAWRRNKLIVCFDEFEIPHNKQGSNMLSKLREWITEPRASVRAMQKMGEDALLYENYIFFSNQHNMLPIPEDERRYNICPRQNVKLKSVCDTVQLYTGIRSEIARFGSMLHAWTTSESQARDNMNNEAKAVAREASRTMPEEFFNAMRTGDLDYMLQLFESLDGAISPNQILEFDAARRTVTSMIRHRNNVTPFSVAELTNLFNVMYDQTMSVMAFGKMLSRFGAPGVRYRSGGELLRGYALNFAKTSLTDHDLNTLLTSRRGLTVVQGAVA